ncbi:VCBS repeat protein [Pontibacter ummariensis]|uniref:Repeat domain-containing protein n=1 Tax=Pontibacter ummariensis TaxID=1610492 RepID=A0A239B743_9BACT|nr:VCBS repeat-containing protein [Pontibacter ummariensis]PRY16358.1 VCBS repeat protein [Pontibacter ummariensis]SNS03757.1 Repeat domain-containing protein [Pontibacter ummariensis]
MKRLFFYFIGTSLLLGSCNQDKGDQLFHLLSPEDTGITFSNTLLENDTLNAVEYDYLYNGAGVAIGDINNDGLQDIFFGGNMVSSKLYLNKGNMKFEDVTEKAGVMTDRWVTGVSMADVNSDGHIDIYACVAGPNKTPDKPNMLFINNGDGTFTESAKAYGVADTGYSTQAAFFDYDKDGDLDMYLLTNALESFPRNNARPKKVDGQGLSTDRLYRNNGNNTFTNVSREAGILIEGYGLGIGIADINNDGWPDVYAANDFITNDLLYINNGDGTFSDQSRQYLKHQSWNAMGTDIADFNNDGLLDIVTVDMLPPDNLREKTMIAAANYDRFKHNLSLGYQPQYIRNTLQLNNGNGTFSEVGQLAGIHRTDWSWAPLFADYDNDGQRDLLITNGYRKDVTNLDFIIYKRQESQFGDEAHKSQTMAKLIKELPGVKVHNYVYQNTGNLSFADKSVEWGLDAPSYTNGTAFADLDNDGDLDLIMNNIDQQAFIYSNNANTLPDRHYLRVKFEGDQKNKAGMGVKLTLRYGERQLYHDHSVYRGYKSTVENVAHFGLGKDTLVNTLEIVWPDGRQQTLQNVKADQVLTLKHADAVAPATAPASAPIATLFQPLDSTVTGIGYKHKEYDFVDFKLQPLLMQKYSQGGPGLAVGDVNGDGLEDFYVGGSSDAAGKLYLQLTGGKFKEAPFTDTDKHSDDMGALFFDADNDGDLDLYVVSGGSEFQEGAAEYQDRLYRNDGKGAFEKSTSALPDTRSSGSCVIAADYDRDGDLDLFVGGRVVPQRYPLPAKSYILQNNGGHFTDVTAQVCPELTQYGLITAALWTDADNDGQVDLMVAGEWMPVSLFKNKNGKFANVTQDSGLQDAVGWWNSLAAGDFDNDGDIDYIGGNFGLNSDYKASAKAPVSITAKDFDSNGSIDPVLGHYLMGKNYPAHPRDAMTDQMVTLRRKYQSFDSYARIGYEELFPEEWLRGAITAKSTHLQSSYIQNLGKGTFKVHPLPVQAQVAPAFGMAVNDYNGDGNLDLLLTGNNYGTEIQTGWYDASIGLYLHGNGKGGFAPVPVTRSGFFVDSDAKALAELALPTGQTMVLSSSNQGTIKAFRYGQQKRVVQLSPADAWASITLQDGREVRQEFYYGATYLSQSSRTLAVPAGARAITIYDFKGKGREVALQQESLALHP